MAKHRVVVADHNFEDLSVEKNALKDIATVEVLDKQNDETARQQLAAADAVFVRMYDLDEEKIKQMEQCRVISRYGIGVDHIDVEAATRNGIYVANAPTYCIEEVTNHTIALLLGVSRRLKEYDNLMSRGDWKDADTFSRLPIHRLSDQTVGIVGFGKIGQQVAEQLSSFAEKILVADPSLSSDDLPPYNIEATTFDDLVRRVDYVTIHAPLTDETRDLFDEDVFASMKSTAYLINASRGPIVDTAALVDAIDANEIAGAALDVFPEEPPDETSTIRNHERILTTPHVAYYSEEADEERREQAIENVRAGIEGEEPPHALNEI